MAIVSCKHRSTRAAYLVGMLIVRRLKGLAGDLGPSPLQRDVFARATREPFQVFFVSHSSVLRRFGKQMFLLRSAEGSQLCWL